MKTKERDIKYCGCNIDNINSIKLEDINLYNIKVFYYYITERYSIFKRRESGEKYPWTDDIILRSYRFTNVFREYDKTTRWLTKHISNNRKFLYSERIFRTILFRLYNSIDTVKIMRLNSKDFDWSAECISNIYYKMEDYGSDVYTRAYKTVGFKSNMSKIYHDYNYKLYPLLYMKDFRKRYCNNIEEIINNSKDQKEIYKFIKCIPGIGEFLGYQIFVDLTYIKEFPYSENEFVVCGPGCRKGMDYIFNTTNCTYEEKLFWLRDNIDNIFRKIDNSYNPDILFDNRESYDRNLNIMSLENCFCEFQKFMYSYTGVGAPKRKYPENK